LVQRKGNNLRTLETARRAMKQLAARERKARIAAYLQYLKSRPATPTSPPRVIADGDSWFDYPEILLAGGGVINHLKDVSGVKILNTAHYGDSVQQMLGVEKRQRIEALLKKPGFDILLFSGGGNDIAGDQFCLWLKPNTRGGAASAVDAGRLQEILGVVEDGYRDLIDIRDRCAPDCWIVTHAYDFPQPRDKGVCGLGPWLKPSLDYRGWKKAADQFAIAKMVLSKFNDRLVALEAEQKAARRQFLHVRTQGTLNRRTDWANEIHPNAAGFTKIAKKFSTALNGISSAFPKFP
jgi:lysophospholipase L1-like esterase